MTRVLRGPAQPLRFDQLELQALVQIREIIDTPAEARSRICARVDGLTLDHATVTPTCLLAPGSRVQAGAWVRNMGR